MHADVVYIMRNMGMCNSGVKDPLALRADEGARIYVFVFVCCVYCLRLACFMSNYGFERKSHQSSIKCVAV